VSILQKSRVQLHITPYSYGVICKECQSFRNQGFSYTKKQALFALIVLVSILQKSRVQLHPVRAADRSGHHPCQSFRNQGFSYTIVVLNGSEKEPTVSILQKSRVQLHEQDCVPCAQSSLVSILQKSRVQLHNGGGNGSRCGDCCVNPSEIKGSVTRTRLRALRAVITCVNPSEIKGSVTQQDCVPCAQSSLCQSFRNQGFSYTLKRRLR